MKISRVAILLGCAVLMPPRIDASDTNEEPATKLVSGPGNLKRRIMTTLDDPDRDGMRKTPKSVRFSDLQPGIDLLGNDIDLDMIYPDDIDGFHLITTEDLPNDQPDQNVAPDKIPEIVIKRGRRGAIHPMEFLGNRDMVFNILINFTKNRIVKRFAQNKFKQY